MNSRFPSLPDYGLSWRSLQVEPITNSGERITIGSIVKGEDRALIAAKLVDGSKLRKLYGQEVGRRIADALQLCIDAAEEFYKTNPLSSSWSPPLEGFYLGSEQNTIAKDIEEGLLISAMHSSSFSVAYEEEKLKNAGRSELSGPENWRKLIEEAVKINHADFEHCFQKEVQIRGSGIPLKFDFVSAKYAAHFDAFSAKGSLQHTLVRAQSKLWQLDRLRDEDSLFSPPECELLLRIPKLEEDVSGDLMGFVEELRYEASKRQLGFYTTNSSIEAAEHLIKQAA